MAKISGYHAHVYFDASTTEAARRICDSAAAQFPVIKGRMHEKPVGPHPRWSCQLAIEPKDFAAVIPWLMLNREGLTVFAHPETGDHLADHRDHALWMGEMLPLDLSIFD